MDVSGDQRTTVDVMYMQRLNKHVCVLKNCPAYYLYVVVFLVLRKSEYASMEIKALGSKIKTDLKHDFGRSA